MTTDEKDKILKKIDELLTNYKYHYDYIELTFVSKNAKINWQTTFHFKKDEKCKKN